MGTQLEEEKEMAAYDLFVAVILLDEVEQKWYMARDSFPHPSDEKVESLFKRLRESLRAREDDLKGE